MTVTLTTHDPREFVRGLQQILISDSKRIGFLFGAGTSLAVKKGASTVSSVPGIDAMTKSVVEGIKEREFSGALGTIQEELSEQKVPGQIENILSLVIQKEQVVGKEKLCGLDREGFGKLRESIEKQVVELVSVHKKMDEFIGDLVHCDFAQWVAHAHQRKVPVEIFTINYDYLLELGLEAQEVPYFDGFVGSFEPFFLSRLVEDKTAYPKHTKLWKLHGSLGWHVNERNRVVRGGRDDSKIIIFPSLLKYQDSKKQPYVSFMDRLSSFLREDDGVLFVCGYSFADQHINDVILNALGGSGTSHVVALYYDEQIEGKGSKYLLTEDSDVTQLAKSSSRLSVYGMRSAVIGGSHGKWMLENEPARDDSILVDLYFDEDAAEPTKKTGKDEHAWTGEGKFRLPDFVAFTEFLRVMNVDTQSGRS